MKHSFALPLMLFCTALSLGCTQTPQIRAPAAESEPVAGRLDVKWSSAIVGMSVVSSAGEKLGRVQDVIVDGYGQSKFAILSYRKAVGAGTKYAAVPWETVAYMLDRDKLIVDWPVLEKAPALAGAGADARNGAWRRDAELYWNGKVASAR